MPAALIKTQKIVIEHQQYLPYTAQDAPVAQLDRALPSEGRGQRFESSRVRQISSDLSNLLIDNLLITFS